MCVGRNESPDSTSIDIIVERPIAMVPINRIRCHLDMSNDARQVHRRVDLIEFVQNCDSLLIDYRYFRICTGEMGAEKKNRRDLARIESLAAREMAANGPLPTTNRFFRMTRGGYVDIWHSYVPSSSLVALAIFSRQLFGYWNSMLYRVLPLYVCRPTVNRSSPLSPGFRLTHETCAMAPFDGGSGGGHSGWNANMNKLNCTRTKNGKAFK